MSQKTTRKGVVEDKEKRQTDSPVKDMKKKMAANAEKEKQASAAEKSETQPEKSTEKQDKNAKQPEKTVDKTPEKSKEDKKVEKNDKSAEKEKKNEKPAEKNTEQAEKPKEDGKGEKSAKKQKQNGHNGVDTPSANGDGLHRTDELNGGDAELNGQGGSPSDEDDDVHEDDEVFPELTYDDSEDSFEPPTPDGVPSRSYTRRSQAKLTRTPETPRPASAKHDGSEDSKESKILKMKDDPLATDRKLRSADSPKPESKKEKKEEAQDKKENKDKQETNEKQEGSKENKDEKAHDKEGEKEKMDVEVVIEVEEEGGRKPDTNYSKSRVKVSPYRRSTRLADQTTSSVMANYTGNNTTMEMDITETSSFISEDPSLDDSYLSGLRSIRGRRSYKPLKEMTLRSIVANKSTRSTASVSASELPSRPTGTVVGRKRKPDAEDSFELAAEAGELAAAPGKRTRLLDRIAQPFRRTTLAGLPSRGGSRRAAEIVGINTDLPLSAPASPPADSFDPESLKPAPPPLPPAHPAAHPAAAADRDAKRCAIM